MAITLAGIELPDDLIWSDEHNWSPVLQTIDVSVNGALIFQEAVQIKGKLFTLSGSENSAWITKATLKLLEAKANTPVLTMTLNYRSEMFSVKFIRKGNESPVQSRQIVDYSDPDDTDFYSVTIYLMEV